MITIQKNIDCRLQILYNLFTNFYGDYLWQSIINAMIL